MLATTLALAVALAGSAAAGPSPVSVSPLDLFKRLSSGCSTSGPASCHNTTSEKDLCCFESPGGLLLQTQFWDTNPSTGPSNSWTIHGLWPDNCDGTFVENCDPSRDYTDIASLLTNQGASDTLSFMQQYWVDINGKNEQFWEHEWSTHGTCYSTLNPSCLPSGSATGAEAVAFFQTVVKLFKTLPTYQWLDINLITPSASETYSLSTLTDALRYASGVEPALNCQGSTLNAIEWYFNVKGSLIDGTFALINAPSKGSCPSTGIKYLPKSGSPASTATSHSSSSSSSKTTTTSRGSTTTTSRISTTTTAHRTTTSGGSSPTGSPSKLPSQGTITASTGGLLSRGTWSTQTLATYHFSGSASSFTMSTSKGDCGVDQDGSFSCGSDVSASTFSAVSKSGGLLLAFSGGTDWSADNAPSGSVQETVYADGNHDKTTTFTIVSS